MQTEISNTAKYILIDYLTKAAAPHMEAAKSLIESFRETAEGFVADLSESVCNATVKADDSAGNIYIAITTEMNERSGFALLHLNCYMGGDLLRVDTWNENEGQREAAAIVNALQHNREFREFARSIAQVYHLDWQPGRAYERAAMELKKSMAE
jgi:hypothetical protein